MKNLPIQKANLSGMTQIKLAEILQPEHRTQLNERMRIRREERKDPAYCSDMGDPAIVDEMDARYEFELEYVVFDDVLCNESIGGDDLNESLNELFYVSLSEHNDVLLNVMDGDTEEYANHMLDHFNHACKDWGVKGKRLVVKSIVPTDEYREFYEAYREIWAD